MHIPAFALAGIWLYAPALDLAGQLSFTPWFSFLRAVCETAMGEGEGGSNRVGDGVK